MTEKEKILEGNKLIAEFMGCVYDGNLWILPTGTKILGDFKYHSSWDWLMPVVEKIAKIKKYEGYLSALAFLEESHSKKCVENINDTWFTVVEFIKWLNNQKVKS